MSLLPEKEKELLRLKMQMEIIRTICPIIMILIQLLIIIKVYQEVSRETIFKTSSNRIFYIFGCNRSRNLGSGYLLHVGRVFHMKHSLITSNDDSPSPSSFEMMIAFFGAGAPVRKRGLFAPHLQIKFQTIWGKCASLLRKSARGRQCESEHYLVQWCK